MNNHYSSSFRPPRRPQGLKGFSLLEVLVATAVLAMVAVAVASIASGTAQITSISQKRMAADATARQALDRIGADLSSAILRKDLKSKIGPAHTDQYEIGFFTRADGYFDGFETSTAPPVRGISEVQYRINDEAQLERGIREFFWTGTSGSELQFNRPDNYVAPVIDAEFFEVISKDVFRFEVAFLMGDGSIEVDIDGLTMGPGADPSENVSAVIVAVAALNESSRELLTGGIDELQDRFPDADASTAPGGGDILSQWSPVLEEIQTDEDLPLPVRRELRIYQRFFYIGD